MSNKSAFEKESAFEKALQLLRLGKHSGLEIVDAIEEIGGLDKPSWQILSEAQTYLTKLQTQAFDASVDAFRRGESQLEVERKLRALGFSPWDSEQVSARAKAKADAEMAPEQKAAARGEQ